MRSIGGSGWGLGVEERQEALRFVKNFANSAAPMARSHAYSRKYSRFARLRLLGFKTPYFRNVNSKKDTQSFFESPLPTSR